MITEIKRGEKNGILGNLITTFKSLPAEKVR